LESADIGLDINSVLLLEALDEMLGDTLVKIFSSEMGISRSGKDLEDSVIDSEEGYIESTTTEIEYNNVLLVLLVKSVGNSGS